MKNPEIFLKHILESIQEVEKYTSGFSSGDFYKNTQVQDAVIRRLEIIGEAVKNLPLSFRTKYAEVPWFKIAGIRDVLIHEYFGVDIGLIWKVVEKDLPVLKKQIVHFLSQI